MEVSREKSMTKAVLSAMIRPLVEPRLPEWVEPL
tara:strand:- start:424 stop:525 length:102 start_codon:yes stop_codon:yes gene_type:complete